MKQIIFTASVLLLFHLPVQAANYSFIFNGKKYEIVKEKRTWPDAAMVAYRKGGHLAEINDQAEQVAIYDAIKKSGISSAYTEAKDGGGVAYIWIGATD
ncbi:MAG: C-type lectin domain-containing protein, partial [Flavipsychrobacter sp.]